MFDFVEKTWLNGFYNTALHDGLIWTVIKYCGQNQVSCMLENLPLPAETIKRYTTYKLYFH